jgi:HK97 family phage prohead protease
VKLLPEAPVTIEGTGTFEGYASLFGVPDLGRDVVVRGAFADSLARRGATGIRMLWQHDPAEPIGRWLRIEEDARGLRVRGRLNPAVARARELASLMSEGAVDGLSIGFRVVEARKDRNGPRRLLKLDLWEISVVTFPMLPKARVAAVETARAFAPPATIPSPAVRLAAAIRRARARLSFNPSTRLT